MRTLSVLTLLLLPLLAVHGAAATDPSVSGPVSVGDRDGDGYTEATVDVDTPQCGCYCPGVGGGVDVEAAGQRTFVGGYTALCQHGVFVDVDPASPVLLGPVVIDPDVYFIGPLRDILDDVAITVTD